MYEFNYLIFFFFSSFALLYCFLNSKCVDICSLHLPFFLGFMRNSSVLKKNAISRQRSWSSYKIKYEWSGRSLWWILWLQSRNYVRVHTPHEPMKYPLWGKDESSWARKYGDARIKDANLRCILLRKSCAAPHIRSLPQCVSLCEQEGWMSSH